MSIRSLSTSTLTEQIRYSKMSASFGAPPFEVKALIVAGGGNGAGTISYCSGGGAGGVLSHNPGDNTGGGLSAYDPIPVNTGTFTLTVGAGGASTVASYSNGNDSVAFGEVAVGGGAGGGFQTGHDQGQDGGSGGGSRKENPGGSGTTGQGFDGGDGTVGETTWPGGGGGAGEAGSASPGSTLPGAAGDGVVTSILTTTQATDNSVGEVSGASVYFGGGGGSTTVTASSGGLGGGADGSGSNGPQNDGAANTGGGGGARFHSSGLPGGAGGSGVIIFRVPSLVSVSFSAGVTSTAINEGLETLYIVTAAGPSDTVTIG